MAGPRAFVGICRFPGAGHRRKAGYKPGAAAGGGDQPAGRPGRPAPGEREGAPGRPLRGRRELRGALLGLLVRRRGAPACVSPGDGDFFVQVSRETALGESLHFTIGLIIIKTLRFSGGL